MLAEGGLQGLETPTGYLDNVLPFNPEIDAVFVFESGWRQAIELRDDRRSGVLKEHAVRLADLVAVSPYSVALDTLIARLDLVARDASDDAAHSCALLLAELGGIAAENGRRASYRPARQAIEGMLERMAIRTPVPPVEQLVSQRFEELLARGMIADYFLETEVERGCQTLLKLAAPVPAGGRQARLAFGLAKIGGAALQWGRISLAANIAFQAAARGIDLSQATLLGEHEAYNARMIFLSSLAGDVFGGDVGGSVVRYVDWAFDLTRTFVAAGDTTTTPAASAPTT